MQQPSSTAEVLTRVKISRVYHMLTGIEPRKTGNGKYRAAALWRKGDGLNVSLDDAKGVWHDFATNEGGGVLDLVVRIRGVDRHGALNWICEYLGIALNDRSMSANEKAEWGRQQRELQQELPNARHWRRAATEMIEDILHEQKAALFDATLPWPEIGEIRRFTVMLAWVESMSGADLVAEYKSWLKHAPGLTWAITKAARDKERQESAPCVGISGFRETHPRFICALSGVCNDGYPRMGERRLP
jgi:hypothetical protein